MVCICVISGAFGCDLKRVQEYDFEVFFAANAPITIELNSVTELEFYANVQIPEVRGFFPSD